MQNSLGFEEVEDVTNRLNAVYARYLLSEPFSLSLFDGFSSLRVLTYSSSISVTVKMLARFETIECVFGYEGVLHDFADILACQKILSENVLVAVKGLDNFGEQLILERIRHGSARFFVVRDAISHSKIYLLERSGKKRVIVGSANFSERAFSGKQAETIVVFDDDEEAWRHYEREYDTVRNGATSELHLSESLQAEIKLEDVPVLQEAQTAKDGLTLFTNVDATTATVPVIIRSVERLAGRYKPLVQPLASVKNGKFVLNREVVGKIIHLVKSQKREHQEQEQTWFSIQRDTKRVLLSGKEISLAVDQEQLRSDVSLLLQYFENFDNGFHGNVAQHQQDYFLFMSWLYFSPFVCDFRNQAIVGQEYIFDFPLFAVLYGKSNCGKTRLIETLMRSMFGHSQFVDKTYFTRTHLRSLLHSYKRFPVVFDDVEKKRFTDHATDIIKDETFMLPEYPAFVLSMNAEDHSFSTELRKRCLILYTNASLPDNTEAAKVLYKSVKNIQTKVSTALYREYLRRVLNELTTNSMPTDILAFSSEIITGIFLEVSKAPLPRWCVSTSINQYQSRKYEKIQNELIKLHETNPAIWEIRANEVILKVQQAESFGLLKEIPDWLKKPGSKAGNIVLDRKAFEEFTGLSFKPKWLRFFSRHT